MMNKSIFNFVHYKDYLHERCGASGTKRGVKTALANALGCQSTYLSHVLHAHAHLSLEQAEKANEFFGHSEEEAAFFFLLLQKDRAGTATLSKYFQAQMDEILKRRLVLTKRLGEKLTLDRESQATYYSSWIYAAVHIALTIPSLRSRETLAAYLHLPLKKISETLDFLRSIGLAKGEGDHYEVGPSQIRLGNDSHNILKHYTNWRTQAIESLDRGPTVDFHYSGVVSLSHSDVAKIKNILLEAVRDSQKVVQDSREEELYALNCDFFTLKRSL